MATMFVTTAKIYAMMSATLPVTKRNVTVPSGMGTPMLLPMMKEKYNMTGKICATIAKISVMTEGAKQYPFRWKKPWPVSRGFLIFGNKGFNLFNTIHHFHLIT
jgi:hypothetical protein